MKSSNITILIVCLLLIYIACLFGPLLSKYLSPLSKYEGFIELVNNDQDHILSELSKMLITSLFIENRASTIRDTSKLADIDNVYDNMIQFIELIDDSDINTLCNKLQNSDTQFAEYKKQVCNNLHVSKIAHADDTSYPFLSYKRNLQPKFSSKNAIIKIDYNEYMMTTLSTLPLHLQFDLNQDSLIRAQFLQIVPAYLISFVLSNPFMIEIESAGIFHVMHDTSIYSNNIMDSYNSRSHESYKIYLKPVQGIYNYNYNSSHGDYISLLNKYPSQSLIFYYLTLSRLNLSTPDFYHCATLHFNKKMGGIFNHSIMSSSTTTILSTNIEFVQNELSINVDSTTYDEINEINQFLSEFKPFEFDIYVEMSFNVVRVALLYKLNANEHGVIIKRLPIKSASGIIKLFSFDPENDECKKPFVNLHIINIMKEALKNNYEFRPSI